MSISYKWTSSCIRKCFIDFFVKNHQHKLVPSSSVISSDPSLLFNNAGMNQFKDIFIGNISPNHPYSELRRAVSSQKCIRTGGKHNDLDVVGYDLTHHTFFEMLGNWSFNSYFKKEACTMAFELITKVYKLPLDKLIITYFAGDKTLSLPADEETKEIWLSLGFPQNRILPTNENFWEMGESGPCGVCSEIYFQLDPSTFSLEKCVEIWNIVFIQYYKDESGIVTKLPANHVDTGMGLERMASILNNVPSSYDTDLFQPLLTTISTVCCMNCRILCWIINLQILEYIRRPNLGLIKDLYKITQT
ncbi:alanine--tRNA ligase, mitochondrial-like [Tetranychus urticae]|nr:alanine--tRNA ligase, mitochondrial-like [Tetranychus urticae]